MKLNNDTNVIMCLHKLKFKRYFNSKLNKSLKYCIVLVLKNWAKMFTNI